MFVQTSVRWFAGILSFLAMFSMHLLMLQLIWHPSMASVDDRIVPNAEIVDFIKDIPRFSKEEIATLAQNIVDNVLPGLVEAMVRNSVNLGTCVMQIQNTCDYKTCRKEVMDKLQDVSNGNDTKPVCNASFDWLRCVTKASCAVCSDKLAQASNAIVNGVSFVLAQDKCKEWANDSLKKDELMCTKDGNKLAPLFLQDMIACAKKLTENGTENCSLMAKNATDHYVDTKERLCRYRAMATDCAIPKVCSKCEDKIRTTYITILKAAEPFGNSDCEQWANNISQPQYYCQDLINDEIVEKITALIGFIKNVKEFVYYLKANFLPGVLDIVHEIAECPEKMLNSTDFQTCKKKAERSHSCHTAKESICKRNYAITQCVATSSCKLCNENQVEVAQTLIDLLLSYLTENDCQEWANERPNNTMQTMVECKQNGIILSPLKLEKVLACKKTYTEEFGKCVDKSEQETAFINYLPEKVCKFAISEVKCSIPLVCEHCESGTSEDYFKFLQLFETRAKACDEKWHTGSVQLTCLPHIQSTEDSDYPQDNLATKGPRMNNWEIGGIIALISSAVVAGTVMIRKMSNQPITSNAVKSSEPPEEGNIIRNGEEEVKNEKVTEVKNKEVDQIGPQVKQIHEPTETKVESSSNEHPTAAALDQAQLQTTSATSDKVSREEHKVKSQLMSLHRSPLKASTGRSQPITDKEVTSDEKKADIPEISNHIPRAPVLSAPTGFKRTEQKSPEPKTLNTLDDKTDREMTTDVTEANVIEMPKPLASAAPVVLPTLTGVKPINSYESNEVNADSKQTVCEIETDKTALSDAKVEKSFNKIESIPQPSSSTPAPTGPSISLATSRPKSAGMKNSANKSLPRPIILPSRKMQTYKSPAPTNVLKSLMEKSKIMINGSKSAGHRSTITAPPTLHPESESKSIGLKCFIPNVSINERTEKLFNEAKSNVVDGPGAKTSDDKMDESNDTVEVNGEDKIKSSEQKESDVCASKQAQKLPSPTKSKSNISNALSELDKKEDNDNVKSLDPKTSSSPLQVFLPTSGTSSVASNKFVSSSPELSTASQPLPLPTKVNEPTPTDLPVPLKSLTFLPKSSKTQSALNDPQSAKSIGQTAANDENKTFALPKLIPPVSLPSTVGPKSLLPLTTSIGLPRPPMAPPSALSGSISGSKAPELPPMVLRGTKSSSNGFKMVSLKAASKAGFYAGGATKTAGPNAGPKRGREY